VLLQDFEACCELKGKETILCQHSAILGRTFDAGVILRKSACGLTKDLNDFDRQQLLY
jgi:hypothetical protein